MEYVYDLNGGMTEEVRTEKGTSVKSSYTYDALGRLTGFVSSDGQSESYRYDAAGNMLEKQRNNRKITMTYDAANRLRTMESGGKTLRYAYDGSGNLLQKTLGNRVDSYSYDAYNRLVSYRGYDGYRQRYSYSAEGHLTKKETQGSGNRRTLEEIVCGDGDKQAAEGEDDPDPDPYGGAATSAQAAPAPSAAARQVTSYVYDITAPYYAVLTETTEGATVSYDYGLERLAAHSADFWASRRTEYLYDGRGSVALEYSYNSSWYTLGGALSPGETVSRRYTPFGEPLAGGASPLSRNGTYYGYNGESYDPATGMLNLRARQYEPAQMRFSQQDLLRGDLSAPTTLNRYLYCVNDPVNFADYDGLFLKELWNKAKNVVTKTVDAVKNVAKKTVSAVKSVVTNVSGKVSTAAKAVTQTVKTVVNTAKTMAGIARTDGLKNALSGLPTSAKATAWQGKVIQAAAKAAIQADNARTAQELAETKAEARQIVADWAGAFMRSSLPETRRLSTTRSRKSGNFWQTAPARPKSSGSFAAPVPRLRRMLGRQRPKQ